MKYIVVLCAMILTSCALPKDNFSKWERCLNKSDLTDYDCEQCDRKHNPSRNFTIWGDTIRDDKPVEHLIVIEREDSIDSIHIDSDFKLIDIVITKK